MNLPNKITLARLLMIPLFMVCYLWLGVESWIPALIFVLASLSDTLDGIIARRDHLVTDFGKFMDPLADKILTMSAWILFVEDQLIPGWIVVIILAREFFITGFRTIAASKGVTMAASKWGKLKTITQMVTICFILFQRNLLSFIPAGASTVLGRVLIILSLILTLISGLDYLVKNIDLLDLDHM